MSRDKQIEEILKVVNQLTFDLRTNMTSITRYVKHEREKHPSLTEGQFIDRHLKYKELANEAVDNILKCLNDNEELRQIEGMRFDTDKPQKYAECSACGKKLYLGEKVLTVPQYCGVYCSPNCIVTTFCCKTQLTKEFAFYKDVLVKEEAEAKMKGGAE